MSLTILALTLLVLLALECWRDYSGTMAAFESIMDMIRERAR